MEQVELNVKGRQPCGSSGARSLRYSGEIPAVVYGQGLETRHLLIDAHEFSLRVAHSSPTQLFRLRSPQTELDGLMAFVKAVQVEPLKDRVLHVDFLAVREDRTISMTVPLDLVGECLAVKQGNANLNQLAYEVEVECLPTSIPSSLRLDISGLEIGHAIRASAIELPSGVLLKVSPDTVLVSATTIKEEAAPVAEAAAEPQVVGEEKKESEGEAEDSDKGKARD